MTKQQSFNRLEMDGLNRGSTMLEIEGHKVRQRTKENSGNSGKMFTTRWEIDGKRISKANLAELLQVTI